MYRLPEGWAAPELVSDVIVADELAVHRAGVSTVGESGEEICGAAAGQAGPTQDRAWFELLERVSVLEAITAMQAMRGASTHEVTSSTGALIGRWAASEVFPESDAPDQWRYARSNGLALHLDFATASQRAFWELAERDRLVRSWHGEIAPELMDTPSDSFPRTQSYEWKAYSFPERESSAFSHGVAVAGVFGFPTRADTPFVLGFAGRAEPASAFRAASAEAVQLMAFLWGEPLPPPGAVSTSPLPTSGRHLDCYQVRGAHERVRRWLEGGHEQYATGREAARSRETVGFIDLTPSWLSQGLRVVKAVCREAVPLVFGDSPSAAHLPTELRLHPIP